MGANPAGQLLVAALPQSAKLCLIRCIRFPQEVVNRRERAVRVLKELDGQLEPHRALD